MRPVENPNRTTRRRRAGDRPGDAPVEAGSDLSPAGVPVEVAATSGPSAPRADAPAPRADAPAPRADAPAARADAPAPRADAPAARAVTPPPEPVRARLDLDALAAAAGADRAELDRLMADFAPRSRGVNWRPGQRVTGRVSRVTGSTVFLDVGGKADAALDRVDAPADVAVGQSLDCFVLQTRDGELRLTRSLSGEATREMLDEARDNGIPVQGKVVSRNDHGFEVQLSGGVRGFCPLSQIDHSPSADLDSYLDRTLTFRVLDVRGREAVVSHKVIAAEQAREELGRKLTEVREGEVYEGVVTGLREFGAFVRLTTGVEGLVRIPNIGKARIAHPKDVLAEGQAVTVKVLGVDVERRRVDLGIRQALDTAPAGPTPPKAELSSGTAGFGTLAGLLGGVQVAPRRKGR